MGSQASRPSRLYQPAIRPMDLALPGRLFPRQRPTDGRVGQRVDKADRNAAWRNRISGPGPASIGGMAI